MTKRDTPRSAHALHRVEVEAAAGSDLDRVGVAARVLGRAPHLVEQRSEIVAGGAGEEAVADPARAPGRGRRVPADVDLRAARRAPASGTTSAARSS